jgi:hypothetical protein
MSIALKSYIFGASLLLVATCGLDDSSAQGRSSVEEAQVLYEQSCLSCHGSSVFTRPEHKIQTSAALEAQVARCAAGPAKVKWDKSQVKGVADYLGKKYYKF